MPPPRQRLPPCRREHLVVVPINALECEVYEMAVARGALRLQTKVRISRCHDERWGAIYKLVRGGAGGGLDNEAVSSELLRV